MPPPMMMTFIGLEPSCPAPRGQPPAHRRRRVFHSAGPPRNPAPLEGRRQARREPALPSRPLADKLRGGEVLDRGAHRLEDGDLVVVAPSAALAARQLQERSEEHTSELQSLMRISYAVFCLK